LKVKNVVVTSLPADTTLVLYAGSIGAKQALHIILDAAAKLTDLPNLIFLIAGDGPALSSLVARKLPNVKFLSLQPEPLLAELLSPADVHLLPQDTGAADLVLSSKLGGMLASGKPIIVQADHGSELFEFLTGAATFVRCGDAAAMAAALRNMPADTAECAMRRAALATHLAMETILPEFSNLLCHP